MSGLLSAAPAIFLRKERIERMIDAIDKVVNAISSWLYTPWVPAFLIVAGLYFTARTKFIQFRLFGESIHVVSATGTEAATAAPPITWRMRCTSAGSAWCSR